MPPLRRLVVLMVVLLGAQTTSARKHRYGQLNKARYTSERGSSLHIRTARAAARRARAPTMETEVSLEVMDDEVIQITSADGTNPDVRPPNERGTLTRPTSATN